MSRCLVRFKIYHDFMSKKQDFMSGVIISYIIYYHGIIRFMTSLSGDNQADIIAAFNSTSRYLDDLLKDICW